MLKKGDMVMLAFVLVAAVLGFAGVKYYGYLNRDAHRIAVIKQGDAVIRTIDLDTVSKPERISVSGSYNETVLVEKGRIRFEDANCPDRICVKTGWLDKNGDTAVCLPGKTIIKIEGESGKVDVISY